MNQYLPHLISIRNEFGRFNVKQRDRNKWEIIIERQSTSLVNNYKNLLFVKKKKKIIELKQFYNWKDILIVPMLIHTWNQLYWSRRRNMNFEDEITPES